MRNEVVGKRFPISALTALGVALLAAPAPVSAQGQNSPRPVVAVATRSDTSVPLRQIPVRPPAPVVLGEIFERPRKLLPNREESPSIPGDGAVQAPSASPAAPAVQGNFDGIGNVNGVLPPDPTGAVGPNHYVQAVNLSYTIYDRNGSTLRGPDNINTLFAGLGGPCATTNDGDPIVLYDHLADRWLISQFALPNFPSGPFYQCVAISATGNPLDRWHRYEFTISSSRLNDYPKFGIWPDGYYMSINQYTCNFIRCRWAGQGVVAFDRARMLAGQTAQMVYFDLNSVDPNLGGMLPSDLDGPAPPPGAPNIFSQADDNAWGYSPDQLQLWEFRVNWASPASSTFTHLANLPTAAFDSNMCGYARNCIPQPNTSARLDAISDRLMYRLQYRNFVTHQSLLTNHTVDASGGDRAGIRWYELRNSGSGWSIHQQGTYSPDTTHRWMGSVAMNQQGDVALGYSVSSGSMFPSVRATGRLAGDASGQMTQGEATLAAGGGSQTHTASRWGDYSHMSVDPTDDCTFWYTQEYYATTGLAPWRTRISSFKLRDCNGGGGDVHDVAVTAVSAPSPVPVNSAQTVQVTVQNQGTVTETFTVSLADNLGAVIPDSPQTLTGLAAGASTTLSFGWTPTAIGTHTLTATATLSGDSNAANNSGSATSTVNSGSPAPTISGISPNSMPRGSSVQVTISGANFVAGATVEFLNGNGPAPQVSNVLVTGPGEITCTVTVPSQGPRNRTWDVRVTNPDGQSATLVAAFTVT